MNIKKIAAAMVSAAVVCSSATALAATLTSKYSDNFEYQEISEVNEQEYDNAWRFTTDGTGWIQVDITSDSLEVDTKYNINVGLAYVSGSATANGEYYHFYDNNNIKTSNIFQNGIMSAGVSKTNSHEITVTSADKSTVKFELILRDMQEGSVADFGYSVVPTAYKVTAGEGVTLNGVEDDGYVTAGSTVSYTYNEKEYTSEAITAPTVIEAPTEDETVIDAAALNGGEAYEDGSMGWTVTAGDPETTMTYAKWLITNDEGVTVQKEAAMTTFTGKAVFGLVLTRIPRRTVDHFGSLFLLELLRSRCVDGIMSVI